MKVRLPFLIAVAAPLIVATAADEGSFFTNLLSNFVSSEAGAEHGGKHNEAEPQASHSGPQMQKPPAMMRGSSAIQEDQHHRMLSGCTGANKKLPRCQKDKAEVSQAAPTNNDNSGSDSNDSKKDKDNDKDKAKNSPSESVDLNDPELLGEEWGIRYNKKKVKKERVGYSDSFDTGFAQSLTGPNNRKKHKSEENDADKYDSVDYWDVDDMDDPASYFKKAEKLDKQYQKLKKKLYSQHPDERTKEDINKFQKMERTLDARFKHAPGLSIAEKKKMVKMQREIRALEKNDPEQVEKLTKGLKKLKLKEKRSGLSDAEKKKVAEFEKRIKENTRGDPEKIKELKKKMKSMEKKALNRLRRERANQEYKDWDTHQKRRKQNGVQSDSVEIKKWANNFNDQAGNSIKKKLRKNGVTDENAEKVSQDITNVMAKYAVDQSHDPYGAVDGYDLYNVIKKNMRKNGISEEQAHGMAEEFTIAFAGAVFEAFDATYG